jgi:hypothetical protein
MYDERERKKDADVPFIARKSHPPDERAGLVICLRARTERITYNFWRHNGTDFWASQRVVFCYVYALKGSIQHRYKSISIINEYSNLEDKQTLSGIEDLSFHLISKSRLGSL